MREEESSEGVKRLQSTEASKKGDDILFVHRAPTCVMDAEEEIISKTFRGPFEERQDHFSILLTCCSPSFQSVKPKQLSK